MRNFLTFQIESWIGAVFVISLAGFFIGFLFISMKNFDSDISLLDVSQSSIKGISQTERILIKNWVDTNNVQVPEGKGFRYLINKYPSKPWLSSSNLSD